jgi:hypothetical protein
VSALLTIVTVGTCAVALLSAHAYSDWAGLAGVSTVIWLSGWIAIWLPTTEWTVQGRQLFLRDWITRPGSPRSSVMELGPQLEIVHERHGLWRIRPDGPQIFLWPGQASTLTLVMRCAGVRVTDFHGEWEGRHRVIHALGLLAPLGGIAALGAVLAIGLGAPIGDLAFASFIATALLSFAIDGLPWTTRGRAARED